MLDSINQIVDQVKEVVESGIQHQLDTGQTINFLSLIGEKLNEDYETLSTLFSSKVGCTLETFIDQRKIEKVKEFLVYTDISLAEIAHVLGYSSTSHLLDQLIKHTGCTSSHYKQVRRDKLEIIRKHTKTH